MGIEIGEVALNGQPLNGIDIVGTPDLRAKTEHAQIKAVAAGRAAFQQDVGAGCEDPIQHFIQAEDVVVRLASQSDAVAVHIPLHVGDGSVIQRVGDIFHNVVPHLRQRQVQQQLMAAGQWCKFIGQGPVGMGAVQVGIHVDGFRFKPQAELQAQTADLVGKAAQSVGELFGVDGIVAQPRFVIVSLSEPAVIQYKQFAAQFFGVFCQLHQPAVMEVKHTAFPAVEQDRTLPILPVGGNDVAVDKSVHGFRQTGKAAIGEGQCRLRGFQRFAGLQGFEEIGGGNALYHAGQSLQRLLRGGIVVAGIDEVKAVYDAAVLCGVRFAEKESGVVPVGGETGDALVDDTGGGNGYGVIPHFCDPAAVEGGHAEVTGQIHQAAHQLGDSSGGVAGVFQDCAPQQNAACHAEIELQFQTRLSQGQLQCLAHTLCLRKTGLHGNGVVQDLMGAVSEVTGNTAQLQRTFPIVATSGAAPCQHHSVGTAAGILILQQNGCTPAKTGMAGENIAVLCGYRLTEMQQFHQTVWIDPQQTGETVAVDTEKTVFILDHRILYSCPATNC